MALYFPSASMLFPGVDEVDGVKVAKVHQHGSVVFVVLEDDSVLSFDQFDRVPVSNPQVVEDGHPAAQVKPKVNSYEEWLAQFKAEHGVSA